MSVVCSTPRLVLRQLCESDASFIVELLNDAAFIQNIGDKGVRTLDDARHYIRIGPQASYANFGFGLNCVELKDGGAPIGICGLVKRQELADIDIGFAFLPDYRSKGHGFEAGRAILDHARERLGIERIVAMVAPHNRISIRLLQRLGMQFERMIRPAAEDVDVKLFALKRTRTE